MKVLDPAEEIKDKAVPQHGEVSSLLGLLIFTDSAKGYPVVLLCGPFHFNQIGIMSRLTPQSTSSEIGYKVLELRIFPNKSLCFI